MQIWRVSFYKWATRDSRRYANHKSGKKYRRNPQQAESKAAEKEARKEVLPLDVDPVKAQCATIFKKKWDEAKANPKYQQLMARHKEKYRDRDGTKAN